MSVMKRILNPYLRLTERPHMAKATPEKLRSSLEWKSKLFFWPPRGTKFSALQLTDGLHHLDSVLVDPPSKTEGPLLLYFHGGGYVFGSPDTHKSMLAWLSKATGLQACLPKYRLAPQHPFPAAQDDALFAYRDVMDHPHGVVLGGDSAGGGLALSLLAEITRLGLPQPRGTFCFSPLTDLSFTAPSIQANAPSDVVLPASRTAEIAEIFLQGANPAHPKASPLHAQFAGAGPVWLAVGDTEILLDDSTNMARHLQGQGVDATLVVEQDLPHVWPLFHNMLPEARQTLSALADWIRHLPKRAVDN